MNRDQGFISDIGMAMFGLLAGFGLFVIIGLTGVSYIIRSIATLP